MKRALINRLSLLSSSISSNYHEFKYIFDLFGGRVSDTSDKYIQVFLRDDVNKWSVGVEEFWAFIAESNVDFSVWKMMNRFF